ncbi:DUF6402 family protein [uncultured Aquimarina sp.]|uniref:DUF6402 family protein n=1 Tax=uncultured Aquimarina sp. TaxID=575652 RepID=UPI00262FFBB4|nr:DUF6402 family protein [uncultured Aquimarina sp.]
MVLDFGNDKAYVKFTPEKDVKATSYTIKVFALNKTDGGTKKHVYTSKSYTLNKKGENRWYKVIDYSFYNAVAKKVASSGKVLPNIIEFSFKIVLDDEEEEVPDIYEVHFIRYIPALMSIKGWTNAVNLQKIWFTKGKNDDKKSVDPEIDAFTWSWVVAESSQVNGEYEEFFRDTKNELDAYFNNNVKKALKGEIRKMIPKGLATLPDASNKTTSFGTFDTAIETYRSEKMPKFEVYYFNSKPFSGFWDLGLHYAFDGIDDFIATLANFNYHVAAKGQLEYDAGGMFSSPSTKIKVQELAFFIKDNFDFVDDDPNEPSQPLGYWKIKSKTELEVERSEPSNVGDYYEVTNKSYRDYRDVHNMGYDFHVYSTLNKQTVDIELSL